VGSRCSFCGTDEGPFRQIEGLFALLMCAGCQAARASSNRGPPRTSVQPPMRDPGQPAEVLARHDPGQPWYKWGCPLPGCDCWVILPWDLEPHAAADHPGWVARYELVRPLPRQHERVVFQRVKEPPTS
jgi:hypothetical protein